MKIIREKVGFKQNDGVNVIVKCIVLGSFEIHTRWLSHYYHIYLKGTKIKNITTEKNLFFNNSKCILLLNLDG